MGKVLSTSLQKKRGKRVRVELALHSCRNYLIMMQSLGCVESDYGQMVIRYAGLLGEWERLL